MVDRNRAIDGDLLPNLDGTVVQVDHLDRPTIPPEIGQDVMAQSCMMSMLRYTRNIGEFVCGGALLAGGLTGNVPLFLGGAIPLGIDNTVYLFSKGVRSVIIWYREELESAP